MTILSKAFAGARKLEDNELDLVGAGSGYQFNTPYSYTYSTESGGSYTYTTVTGYATDYYNVD